MHQRLSALNLIAAAALLTSCQGAPIPPHAAPVDANLLTVAAPDQLPPGGGEGASQPVDPPPPETGAGGGGGAENPTPPTNPPTVPMPETPTNTLVDLQCPDGACLNLAITAPRPGQNVDHYDGAIYKGGMLVATFSLPASGNLATLHVGNMGNGLDYYVKLSAYDNAGHRINKHAPGVESYGPFKPAGGQCLADSVAVPTLPMPSPT